MNKPSLLIIDDQPWQVGHLLAELREEFFAEVEPDPLSAARLLQSGAKIDALLLDIMMPSPSVELIEKTARGLDTGLWFLDHMSDLFISIKLPIIILSNRLQERIEARVAEMPYPKGQIAIMMKQETSDQLLRIDVRHAVLKRGDLSGFQTADYLNGLLGEFAAEVDALSKKCRTSAELEQFAGNSQFLNQFLQSQGISEESALAAASAFMPYVELHQLKCVGPRYASLLIQAGIGSLQDLADATALPLYWKVRELNQQCGLFETELPPTEVQVAHWVEVARKIKTNR